MMLSKNGFLGVKLSESDDKQFICCYRASFLPLKTFGTFGHKSIEKYFLLKDSSTSVGMMITHLLILISIKK